MRVYVQPTTSRHPHQALRIEAPGPPVSLSAVRDDQRPGICRRDLLGRLLLSADELHQRFSAPYRCCWSQAAARSWASIR